MPAPVNSFKAALQTEGDLLTGLWVALANPHSAEICAGAGFDWILVDAEHGPNDIPLIATQLAAVTRHPAHPVVRLPVGEPWLIKQALDIGAQTLMIPMVETAEQAALLAKALRYPPFGIRGMGASLGRASDFGRITDYAETANEQVCLIAQIESRLGVENAEAILATEGVDAVLIGPADLAADMGYRGKATVPEVKETVEALIGKIKAAGVSNYTTAQVAALSAHMPFPLLSIQPDRCALHGERHRYRAPGPRGCGHGRTDAQSGCEGRRVAALCRLLIVCPVDGVALQLVVEGLARDAERFDRLAHVALGLAQRLADQRRLVFLHAVR